MACKAVSRWLLSTEDTYLWYVLKVRTRSEIVAAAALRNKGYELFLPTYLERRCYCDRIRTVEVPAFPGYIFCRFNLCEKAPILSSPAVEYIVGFAAGPAPVPETELESIRRSLAVGARPTPYLSVGQRVRVKDGAFAGIEGVLRHVNNRSQLIVSIHLLCRSVALHIDETQLVAA
jgi:transcription antitermination factor NusG